MKPITLKWIFVFRLSKLCSEILLDRDSLGKTGGNLRRAVGTRDISSFAFSVHSFFYFFLFPVWWRLGTYDLSYFSVFILTPFSTEHWTSMLWFPHTPSAQISWIAKEYSPDSKAVMLFFVNIPKYSSSLSSDIFSASHICSYHVSFWDSIGFPIMALLGLVITTVGRTYFSDTSLQYSTIFWSHHFQETGLKYFIKERQWLVWFSWPRLRILLGSLRIFWMCA